jgi:hypothetical protein
MGLLELLLYPFFESANLCIAYLIAAAINLVAYIAFVNNVMWAYGMIWGTITGFSIIFGLMVFIAMILSG